MTTKEDSERLDQVFLLFLSFLCQSLKILFFFMFQVQARFMVDIKPVPDKLEQLKFASKNCCFNCCLTVVQLFTHLPFRQEEIIGYSQLPSVCLPIMGRFLHNIFLLLSFESIVCFEND